MSDYELEALRQQLAWETSKIHSVRMGDTVYVFHRTQSVNMKHEFVEYIPQPSVK